jgi:site-specific DNA recombinase
MKLIGYCRVSSKGQTDNTSLASQMAEIEQYCNAHDHELVNVFIETASGGKIDRPKFVEAIEAVNDADGLVVAKLDRFARTTRGLLTLIEDSFIPKQKRLILLNLNGIDASDPIGKLILTIVSGTAEAELGLIRQRTNAGRQAAMSNGVRFGTPKYGEKVSQKERVTVDDETKVIEFIRRQKRNGTSLLGIARKLNDRSIPTKQGKQWTAQGVKNILGRFKTYSKQSC